MGSKAAVVSGFCAVGIALPITVLSYVTFLAGVVEKRLTRWQQ